jgi:hypothetical protein
MARSFGSITAIATLFLPARANASVNAGAEVGLVKRTFGSSNETASGLGYGFHIEAELGRYVTLGPYFLQGAFPAETSYSFTAASDTLGIRARLFAPLKVIRPYVVAGLGYGWMSYERSSEMNWICGEVSPCTVPASGSGHFLEMPLGVGVAFVVDSVFQLSVDLVYRPYFAFGGDAYDVSPAHPHPTEGWSSMLGAAFTF